jgi:hypothetical protein
MERPVVARGDKPKSDEAKDETEGDGRVRFTPSPQVWAYLTWLSRNTMLGKTEHEVAENLLVQRLTEMRQENYKVEKL